MVSIVKVYGYQDHRLKAVGRDVEIPETSLFFLTITDNQTNQEKGFVYGYNLTPRHPHILWKFENKTMGQSFFDHYCPEILPFGYRITTENFLSMVFVAIDAHGGVINVEKIPRDKEREVSQIPRSTRLEKQLELGEKRFEELGQLLMEHIHNTPDRLKREIIIEEMIALSRKMVVLYYLVDHKFDQVRRQG